MSTNPALPRFLAAGVSDQGQVRGNNEDRIHFDEVRGIFLVVDGMGGHEAGEHAAEIAVERIKARLERQTGTVEQRIREAITLANNAIFETAQDKPEWQGMACVLTTAVIEDGQATIGHVGDSRLYRLKRGRIEKITHDHSPVGEREDQGELTEAQAMQHPRRNEVYRDVGSEERTPDDPDFIEIRRIPFEPDGALLLCSDGLSDAISSAEILKIVEENAGDRWAAVRALITAAAEVGKDNISVVFVEGEKFALTFGKPVTPTAKSKPRQVIVTDPPTPEITARFPVQPLPAERAPLLLRAPSYLIYGLLLGALIFYGVQRYLLPLPPTVVGTQTIVVKTPDTIAAALEKAHTGDTVSVAPGTYTGQVHLKDGVDLIAQRPHDVIIEGSVVGDGIRSGRFEGFQVRAPGVAVTLHDSDVELVRDEISQASDAGVLFSGNSRGALIGSWVHDNEGPGIVVADTASPDITNNLIASNGGKPTSGAGHGLRPGLLIKSTVHPRVTDNIFLSNAAEAIWLPKADDSMMDRNYFNVSGKPDRRPKFRIVAPAEPAHESR